MEHAVNAKEPQLEQSLSRLKAVVAALEGRIAGLVEQSLGAEDLHARMDEQQHQLHVLKEELVAVQKENAVLRATLTETEKKYDALRRVGQGVQGQIDNAINDLQRLLEKEKVDS